MKRLFSIPFILFAYITVVSCGGERPIEFETLTFKESGILSDGGSIFIHAETESEEKLDIYLDASLSSDPMKSEPILSINGNKLNPGSEQELKVIAGLHQWVISNSGRNSVKSTRDAFFASNNPDTKLANAVSVISLVEMICVTRVNNRPLYSEPCSDFLADSQ